MKARSYNSPLAVEALEGRTMMSAVSHGEYNDGREAAAVGVLALAAPVQGTAVGLPHVSSGTAQFAANGSDFAGAGTATHLGRYTEAGSATFTPTADPTVLHVEAHSTYTAANGDQLFASFSGELNGVTGAVTATVTYVGGTGRFANASGTATFSGQLLPGGAIQASANGTINY
jgi:hypothetical protein